MTAVLSCFVILINNAVLNPQSSPIEQGVNPSSTVETPSFIQGMSQSDEVSTSPIVPQDETSNPFSTKR